LYIHIGTLAAAMPPRHLFCICYIAIVVFTSFAGCAAVKGILKLDGYTSVTAAKAPSSDARQNMRPVQVRPRR
jgi:hypothetical protein